MGILAARSRRSISGVSTVHATTGLPVSAWARATASPYSGRSRPTSMASAPATSGSARTRETAGSKARGAIWGGMSTGVPSAPEAGREGRGRGRGGPGGGGPRGPPRLGGSGGDDRRPAGDGEDGEPGVAGQAVAGRGQGSQGVEELLGVVHGHDAGRPEGRPVGLVATRQRARVRPG